MNFEITLKSGEIVIGRVTTKRRSEKIPDIVPIEDQSDYIQTLCEMDRALQTHKFVAVHDATTSNQVLFETARIRSVVEYKK